MFLVFKVQIRQCPVLNLDLSNFPGLIFRDRKTAKVINTGIPLAEKELDKLSFPARELIPRNKYTALAPFFHGKWTSIITTRGCPCNCIFCSWPNIKYRLYRSRSALSVVEEIKHIYENGYQFLYIVDANFLANPRRAMEIAEGVIENGIELRMTINGRVDSADPVLYSQLRRAGVRIIGFGLESGDQGVLDFFKKGTTVEQNKIAVDITDRCKMYSHGHFMIGSPVDTPETIERTIEFAKSLPLDTAFFSFVHYKKRSPYLV